MGCNYSTIALEQGNVLSSYPYNLQEHELFLEDSGAPVALYCATGNTLIYNNGAPVPNGVYILECDIGAGGVTNQDDVHDLPAPPISCVPDHADTSDTRSSTNVNQPSSSSSSSFVDCPIPEMPGILGYQGAARIDQLEIVRFPVSNSGNNTVYHLKPHDTITFACEDSSQEMKLNGVAIEPHDVNFYTYTCLTDDPNEDFNLPLTCSSGEDSDSSQRRKLLRGQQPSNTLN